MWRPKRQVACRAAFAAQPKLRRWRARRISCSWPRAVGAARARSARPDAVRLAEVDGMVEALALHRAFATDRLGPRFADIAVFAPLGVGRRKEQGRLRT